MHEAGVPLPTTVVGFEVSRRATGEVHAFLGNAHGWTRHVETNNQMIGDTVIDESISLFDSGISYLLTKRTTYAVNLTVFIAPIDRHLCHSIPILIKLKN